MCSSMRRGIYIPGRVKWDELEAIQKGGEESCFDGEEVSDGVRGRSGKDSVVDSNDTDRGRCE